ncbi:ribosome biogenesis GTP-binding protein YihA/YsxC [Candidatus Methylopumilus turicensis]|uniref:Probable GTP-binding protein EngB n=1 Tax=Candidatus Methylopumilus turicensis TaxID=1581680 RepID=A0A0B7ISL0_9PROT|nr:ribosome biogenesis GTP-binding protein YihA/YsxC [Candidatus Methylopumilus turicensis]CEN55238.1 GTP-binding protein [Candidatus Methylopumilus turicensis]
MPLFQNATFYISAHHLRDLPDPVGIEVAFAGRSNAGKSSALNTLANHNRLAYVSKQPGRTQLINFFSLGNDRFLVDLPGYGYAKVPASMRAHWQMTLSKYLSQRSTLYGLVLVMDCRHPLTPLDRQMLDWFSPSGRPIHVLLTKSDKLSRNAANQTLQAVKKELQSIWGNCTIQLFSSLKKQGVEEAETVIGAWLKNDPLLSNENQIPDAVA